jgi:hypothetical protein
MTNEMQEKEISVWIRVPVGIVLILAILLCLAGSLTLFVDPPRENPILGISLGLAFILLSFWGLDKSIRMVCGVRRKGGLVSSTTLKGASFVFLLLPLGGLFTGYYSEKGVAGALQAVGSVGIFLGIRALAKSRDEKVTRGQA